MEKKICRKTPKWGGGGPNGQNGYPVTRKCQKCEKIPKNKKIQKKIMEKKILSKEPILGEKGSKWLKTGFR